MSWNLTECGNPLVEDIGVGSSWVSLISEIGFMGKMGISVMGIPPIAGWFISWKVTIILMDDDWGYVDWKPPNSNLKVLGKQVENPDETGLRIFPRMPILGFFSGCRFLTSLSFLDVEFVSFYRRMNMILIIIDL